MLNAQEAKISVITKLSWPPGKPVPVTVEIAKPGITGFARFFQDLPQGFTVQNLDDSNADFYLENSQLNYVWVELPDEDIITVKYLVQADASLSGSFRLGGRFDYIIGGKERKSVELKALLIKLDKNAKVDDYQIETPQEEDEKPSISEETESEAKIEFRIQVAISSQQISKSILEERLSCTLRHGITVLKAGNMFKYQTGYFNKYEDAVPYLAELKDMGVKDAFIVAFRANEQIAISLARKLTE